MLLLLVLSAALLGPPAVSANRTGAPVVRDVVTGLADACLRGAKKVVTRELRADLQQVQQQLTAMQQQLGSVLSQQQLGSVLSPQQHCPASWVRHGAACYLMPRQHLPWLEAHQACGALDPRAHLASIHETNRRHVGKVVANSSEPYAWIGLFRMPGGVDWGWTDGTPFDYTNWAPAEPNNSGGVEGCGHLVNTEGYTWNDGECTRTGSKAFMCQISLS